MYNASRNSLFHSRHFVSSWCTTKSTAVTNNNNDGFIMFKGPSKPCQHAQLRDPKTSAAKWNSALINIEVTPVPCKNVLCKKDKMTAGQEINCRVLMLY